MKWEQLKDNDKICLYAGDVPPNKGNGVCKHHDCKFVGLSLHRDNANHIKFNVTSDMPLEDDAVDVYQSEDVFEHIPYDCLVDVFNEIYRVLKPGGLFRLSVPDYRCDIIYNRCLKDDEGKVLFDPGGGGSYDSVNKRVRGGGHLWFPVYEQVWALFNASNFSNVDFKHFYDQQGNSVTHKIDYSFGHISRTPDFVIKCQKPWRAWSIVVDAIK